MRKLTPQEIKSLIANNHLAHVVQKVLANKERLMWHTRPVLTAEATDQEKTDYNLAVEAWEQDHKITEFNQRYFPLISDNKSKERFIFVMALADFQYNIDEESISASDNPVDELVDQLSTATYNSMNIFEILVDQMFKAIQFPPKKVELTV